MHSRNQYLAELRADYIGAAKPVKTRLLNEAQKRTKLARKYLIAKLRPEAGPNQPRPRPRKPVYGAAVKTALAKLWPIFDYPCGQRLAPLVRTELDRLRHFGEIQLAPTVCAQLQHISAKTIDRLLAGERQRLRLNRYRNPSVHPLLYHQIPVKVASEWNRRQLGNVQLDFVLHCGQSSSGHFAATLSAADICSGWWEGCAMLGRSQQGTQIALENIRRRLPFPFREIHPDNDACLLNDLVYRWARQHRIRMSRSRPLQKNDNAWVEQHNWTHVRKMIGYRRFDTPDQVQLLNTLYHHLMQYKNFFQPTTKLKRKRRIKGKLHRQYETPRTPYQRLLDSAQLRPAARLSLQRTYARLNPAHLKRTIDQLRSLLFDTFENPAPKRRPPTKKMAPHLVRFFMTQQPAFR